MHISNTPNKMVPTRLFKCALGAAHIPNDLPDKFNETNGLWKFLLPFKEEPVFNDSQAKSGYSEFKKLPYPWVIIHSEEYNTYRRQLGIIFNPLWQIQGYLNNLATGWKGDMYALVQRSKEVSMAKVD